MRKIILYTFTFIFFICCRGQKNQIDMKSQDVLIFNFTAENLDLIKYIDKIYGSNKNESLKIESKINTEVFNTNGIVGITQKWMKYGSRHILKNYTFIKEKDTMSIECRCGQERNYYFKNFPFLKGKFKLEIDNHKVKIWGNQILISKNIKNILFKNTYFSGKTPVFQDAYFKDLKFIEIDLKDSTTVKLKKIE